MKTRPPLLRPASWRVYGRADVQTVAPRLRVSRWAEEGLIAWRYCRNGRRGVARHPILVRLWERRLELMGVRTTGTRGALDLRLPSASHRPRPESSRRSARTLAMLFGPGSASALAEASAQATTPPSQTCLRILSRRGVVFGHVLAVEVKLRERGEGCTAEGDTEQPRYCPCRAPPGPRAPWPWLCGRLHYSDPTRTRRVSMASWLGRR
ncbi:hypothetical protein GQ53DRAFT_531900 [Thozetella sp. PMI_491]|nr:hypothetical protein GQ53DRAFT_531900 [Thozetella sp. PMI_491]